MFKDRQGVPAKNPETDSGKAITATSSTGSATCTVCPNACRLKDGEVGACKARNSAEGRVVPLNYGSCTSLALDPIEKKPFALFRSGTKILSYGSFGCNLACPFCQNHDISTMDGSLYKASGHARYISPDALVDRAATLKLQGNIGVALTYNEPIICPEYLLDTGEIIKQTDMVLAIVTNGFATAKVWDRACEVIDAANIDLKCFSDEGYAQLMAPAARQGRFGALQVVKRNISAAYGAGVHVEITSLIVPGLNDNAEEFEEEVGWIASVSPKIPLHITRFFPRYKMSGAASTDIFLLREFEQIAKKYLAHVFLGNV